MKLIKGAYSGFPVQAAVHVCVWERVEQKESQRARGKADWHFSIMLRQRCKGGGNNFIGCIKPQRAECTIHSFLEDKLTKPKWQREQAVV